MHIYLYMYIFIFTYLWLCFWNWLWHTGSCPAGCARGLCPKCEIVRAVPWICRLGLRFEEIVEWNIPTSNQCHLYSSPYKKVLNNIRRHMYVFMPTLYHHSSHELPCIRCILHCTTLPWIGKFSRFKFSRVLFSPSGEVAKIVDGV